MIATHAATRPRSDLAGRALRLAAVAVAAVLVVVGLDLVRDPTGPDRLFAALYGLLGQGDAADAILARGLEPLQAKLTVMVIALVIGVGGVWLLYIGMDGLVDALPGGLSERVRPFVFLGPALAMLGIFLVIPTIVTIAASLTEDGGAIANWSAVLGSPEMWLAIRNNLIWLVVGTGGSVAIGLLVATLVDRVKREALAKTFIFLPLAISMVGASVIWKFVYAWAPEGEQQIGILNEIWVWLGNEPMPWLQIPPINTFALIVIMIWLQTGFAMVVLSAALKGVPNEVIEAARMDGAGESTVFFRIVIPMIRGTLIAVATTIAIAILKVFDIVYVTTGGRFETEVVANRMFQEMFVFRNFGQASAIAVILFIAVVPIMIVNIRNLRRQGIGS
jgi:alpha-glucoside transport system permease protein